MKEIFKKGLFLIIIALFLFSDFGDDFKAIGNIFLIKAEEISEVEEISQSAENFENDFKQETMYTLYLTHYFRFTVNGKGTYLSEEEKIELSEEDFENGVCDLLQYAYDVDQLMVTQAEPITLDIFDEDRKGGAQILYNVNNGWRIVPIEEAQTEGIALREVFGGKLSDYEFVPANIIRMKLTYKYSNTGAMAGIDAMSPEIIEVIPEKQLDGTYCIETNLPIVEGFRIVLNPEPLNAYLVNPPKGNETPEELENALERGDFNLDADRYIVYYNQENPTGDGIHPNYLNQYSTKYNETWNVARVIKTDQYSAVAIGDEGEGANPIKNPKLRVTLNKDQLKSILEEDMELDLVVYYRRNATWYTVNHWVPKTLSGLDDFSGFETKVENGVDYVLLDHEILHGRVGAMTKANAKTKGIYEKLESIGYSQKSINNAVSGNDARNDTTIIDIYYKPAEFYRVIFDTDYTYIPRQQVKLGDNVDLNVSVPKRIGYTFDGWQYLKKDAQLVDGKYPSDAYVRVDGELTLNDEFISKEAMLQGTQGVLALHLYPIWKPAETEVKVILWTENLTGKDDVQAIAQGGNTTYYDIKYRNYKNDPITHMPQLGQRDSNYSNVGSFTLKLDTDASLVAENNQNALVAEIQHQVEIEFNNFIGTKNEINLNKFYTQAGFEIIHDAGNSVDYSTTVANADGKTMIYVYFTRNIYELEFYYYGANLGTEYCVATRTNGFSYASLSDILNPDNTLKFNYNGSHTLGGTTYYNSWEKTAATSDDEMPVPKIIKIKAKYGADLRDVWPVARNEEKIDTEDGTNNVKMISWAVTDGRYCKEAMLPGSSHFDEPTIMGSYATMDSEIIADPDNTRKIHHLVAYWFGFGGEVDYYRYNHCYEVPNLDITSSGIHSISIYNNSLELNNILYLVPIDNEAILNYGFTDLKTVDFNDGIIDYNVQNGKYYVVRGFVDGGVTRYYALGRQVETVSTNAINKQNPSVREHMTRANANADHTSQYRDEDGVRNRRCGTEENPYDLYFYYNRDRYLITYISPTRNGNATVGEVVLGTIELPYGAEVTQKHYGFVLNYKDTNQTMENGKNKYLWTTTGEAVAVCPDRSINGTAEWCFKGWGLGPSGVNMQWIVQENVDVQEQAEETFAIKGNLDLYAIWEQPIYHVTFHLNGGTVSSSQNIRFEIPANTRFSSKGSIPRPLREGYILSGWYLADENGVLSEPKIAFDFDRPITSNQHVAAVWESVSKEQYDYTIYYVSKKLSNEDQNKLYDTIQIDNDEIVDVGGESYYILEKNEQKNHQFISGAVLNLVSKAKKGYIPLQTNKVLLLVNGKKSYDVIFYYSPISKEEYMIRFVEAGTETKEHPIIVKEIYKSATQIVATPTPVIAKELITMGYELVSKDNDGNYKTVADYLDLTWIDAQGKSQSVRALSHEEIPEIITYLVEPITYTITYQNAASAPTIADEILKSITASANTSIDAAGEKNPTQYSVKDKFTLKNPPIVFDNGKQYRFTHWSLDEGTIVYQKEDIFFELTVDKGTTGHLVFVANWEELIHEETGQLTISNKVEGNYGEKNKDFLFEVTVTGNGESIPLNGLVGDLNFTDGVARFTLKDGESKTVSGLLAGYSYKVEEVDANMNGYKTTAVKDTGFIIADENTLVEFINYRIKNNENETDKNDISGEYAVNTGDNTFNPIMWLSFVGLALIGIVSIIVISKKEKKLC